MAERLTKDGSDHEAAFSIAALHGDELFYQGGLNNDDGFDKEDKYLEFGDYPPEMVEKESQDRIQEAKINGFPNEGA